MVFPCSGRLSSKAVATLFIFMPLFIPSQRNQPIMGLVLISRWLSADPYVAIDGVELRSRQLWPFLRVAIALFSWCLWLHDLLPG